MMVNMVDHQSHLRPGRNRETVNFIILDCQARQNQALGRIRNAS